MAEPVRFVRIKTCKKCGSWLKAGYKEELCPKCLKEVQEEEEKE